MKERRLEGQRSVKASKEVEGCTFEPNLKGRKSPIMRMHQKNIGMKPPLAAIVSKRPLKVPKTGKYGLPTQSRPATSASTHALATYTTAASRSGSGNFRQTTSERQFSSNHPNMPNTCTSNQKNLSYSQLHAAKRHVGSQ